MELKSLQDIPVTFKIVKISLFVCLVVSLLVSACSLFWAYSVVKESKKTTYILTEQGKAVLLNSSSKYKVDQFRKPEIVNHIKEFHTLFFEIDQFNFEKRVNRSLYLIGNSGRDLYKTLEAKKYYSNIAANNLEHKLVVDSVVVNHRVHPYKGKFYGKIIIRRTDQKLKNTEKLYSTFELRNVARTEKNPHGLLIENYRVRGL